MYPDDSLCDNAILYNRLHMWRIADTFKYLSPKQEHGIKTLYVALFILSIHYGLVVFINSSFLEQFLTSSQIGLLYFCASLISVPPMFVLSHFLRKIGNFKLTVILALFEVAALLGMAFSTTLLSAVFFFTLHFAVVPLLLLCLDVFVETIIGKEEKRTGSTRGLYLVCLSIAGAAAPLIAGYLIDLQGFVDFTPAYIASAVAMLPFIAVITLYFKSFKDSSYPRQSIGGMLRAFLAKRDMRNVFFVQLLLQSFFTWMTIYTPVYLATQAGFTWSQIGSILFVALLAYVFFEYPIGVVADKYIGEKEMMAFGFLLIAVSTSWLAFLPSGNIVIWMVALFLTRTGASFVEATSESFFFKHTKGGDADQMSLFRLTRPLSSVITPLAGALLLMHVEFSFTFILLGLAMIPGIIITLQLKDTR